MLIKIFMVCGKIFCILSFICFVLFSVDAPGDWKPCCILSPVITCGDCSYNYCHCLCVLLQTWRRHKLIGVGVCIMVLVVIIQVLLHFLNHLECLFFTAFPFTSLVGLRDTRSTSVAFLSAVPRSFLLTWNNMMKYFPNPLNEKKLLCKVLVIRFPPPPFEVLS